MASALSILAGPRALALIRERGLRSEDIDIVVGASGGPKWLALGGLDDYLFQGLLARPRARPLHLIGSSIGSWRMACLGLPDPAAALARTREAYIEQNYPPRPGPDLVSAKASAILDALLGPDGERALLAHPWARQHVLATQFRGLLAAGRRAPLALGCAAAGLLNLAARGSLKLQMRRAVFHQGDRAPFDRLNDFPTLHLALDAATVKPALMASASLPLIMQHVRIPAGGAQVFMDGGMVDYHPDFDFGAGDGLVFYPHFYPHVVPGWFDKPLPWRRSRYRNFSRALLLAPSPEFVRTLPYGKIPDRDDFKRLPDAERIRYWRQVVRQSQRLADELHELLERGALAQRARAFPGCA
jgi:hypothetical protein